MVNNGKATPAAYILTLEGQQELREFEKGCSTYGADGPGGNSLIDLRFFMKGDFNYDSEIDHACKLVGNSGAFPISEELPQPDSMSMIPTNGP
jgi:hypothetical protein